MFYLMLLRWLLPLLGISAKHSLSVGNKAKQNRTPQSRIKVGMDSTNWNNRCQESLVLLLQNIGWKTRSPRELAFLCMIENPRWGSALRFYHGSQCTYRLCRTALLKLEWALESPEGLVSTEAPEGLVTTSRSRRPGIGPKDEHF